MTRREKRQKRKRRRERTRERERALDELLNASTSHSPAAMPPMRHSVTPNMQAASQTLSCTCDKLIQLSYHVEEEEDDDDVKGVRFMNFKTQLLYTAAFYHAINIKIVNWPAASVCLRIA